MIRPAKRSTPGLSVKKNRIRAEEKTLWKGFKKDASEEKTNGCRKRLGEKTKVRIWVDAFVSKPT